MVSYLYENYWRKALDVSDKAISISKLFPINTTVNQIALSTHIKFECRNISSTNFKFNKIYGPKINPFQPWDYDLEVDLISNNHVLILNKYPVQLGHMLLITTSWQPQDGWLTLDDWKAVKAVDNDTKGLWFFNSCKNSGASQNHRHLQLLRRNDLSNICPMQEIYDDINIRNFYLSQKIRKNIYCIERDHNQDNPEILHKKYLTLCSKMGLGNPIKELRPLHPYNLLISPNWFVIIRRIKDYSHGFNLNALAFAGYLLSTTKSDKKWLNINGPIKLLEEVVP